MIDTRSFGRGEKLIWSGRPSPIAYARRKGTRTFLLGIPFLAFALFWVAKASEAPGGFWLFGIPFVLIGCGLVLSPLWFYFRAGRTAYALTSTRAIVEMAPPFARRRAFRSRPSGSSRSTARPNGPDMCSFSRPWPEIVMEPRPSATASSQSPTRSGSTASLRAAVDNAAKQPAGEAA